MIDIRLLVWDQKNDPHIAEKGINIEYIEEALLHGDLDVQRGRVVKRGDNVLQRYYVIAKAPSGARFKIVLAPVGKRERSWRCITAWKMK